MSEFYAGDDAGDVEQPVGPLEADLAEQGYDREQLDAWAQEIYGLDSWSDVEQQWQDDQAAELERVRQEGIAAAAEKYGHERLGQLTRSIVEKGGPGIEEIHLPHLHDTTAQLLGSRDWLLGHGMPSEVKNAELAEYVQSRGEPLIATALTDALTALTPGQNENQALERFLLKRGW